MKNKALYFTIVMSLLLLGQIAGIIAYGTNSSKRDKRSDNGTVPEKAVVRNDPPGTPRTALSTPGTLSQYFQTAYRSSEPPVGKPREPVSMEIPHNPYRFVGIIKDADGIGRVYIKNLDNNRILKPRLDGIPENGIRYFQDETGKAYLDVDGKKYSIEKDAT